MITWDRCVIAERGGWGGMGRGERETEEADKRKSQATVEEGEEQREIKYQTGLCVWMCRASL